MRVETTELGTLNLTPDQLGEIALYASGAADKYMKDGAVTLGALARTTALEIFTALEKTGRYDDAKETGEKMREIFTATREQSTALAALAYHVADYNYISQRYGSSDPEAYKADANVKDMFNTLDRLEVPSWVRDEVVAFATDWRRYKSVYMDSYLKSKGIDLIPV